ncbi:MAG: DUF2142 domain-containing protein [Firmicutes bacterium]|nr:DUF2142 domain-containing protein [Bacillota bacterium]
MKKIEWSNLWKRYGKLFACLMVFGLLVLGAVTKYKEPIKAHSERSEKIEEYKNKDYKHVEITREGGPILQSIHIDNPKVTGIGVRFWHSEEIKLNALIHVSFKDAALNELYAWDVPGNALNGSQNNDDIVEYYFYFDEADQGTVQGDFVLEISTESLYEETNICVCQAEEDIYPQGQATVNGKTTPLDIHFSLRGEKFLFIRPLYLGLMAVLIFAFIGLAVWLLIKPPKIEVLFLCLSLLFGTVILLVLPPYCVPDESRHINTTYYYSSQLIGEEATDSEGRTLVRSRDRDYTQHEMYPSIISYKRFFGNFFRMDESGGEKAVFVSNEERPLNIPVIAYLPQVIGVSLARLLGFGNVLLLTMGRFFGLLFYSLMVYLAIKITPYFKQLFMMIALMPICLELGASFSYDCTILGLSFLFIAMALRLIYGEVKATWRDFAALSIVMAWMAPVKVVYILIGGMLIFIPKGRDRKTKRNTWIGIFTVLLAGVAAILLTRLEAISTMTGAAHLDEQGGLQYYTLGTILQDPLRFVGVVFNTFYYETDFYLEGLIGGYLGWLDIRVQTYILAGFVILIWLSLLPTRDGKSLILPVGHRLLYAFIFLCVVGAVMLALTFNFTPNEDLLIRGMQGRYFLPAFPLLALAIQPTRMERKKQYETITYALPTYALLFFTCLKAVVTIVARGY